MVSIVMCAEIRPVESLNRVLRLEATLAVVCEPAPCGAVKWDHMPGPPDASDGAWVNNPRNARPDM